MYEICREKRCAFNLKVNWYATTDLFPDKHFKGIPGFSGWTFCMEIHVPPTVMHILHLSSSLSIGFQSYDKH